MSKNLSIKEAQAIVVTLEESLRAVRIEPFISLPIFGIDAQAKLREAHTSNSELVSHYTEAFNVCSRLQLDIETHKLETGLVKLNADYAAASTWINEIGGYLTALSEQNATAIPPMSDISEAQSITVRFASLPKEEVESLAARYESGLAEAENYGAQIDEILNRKLIPIDSSELAIIRRFTAPEPVMG